MRFRGPLGEMIVVSEYTKRSSADRFQYGQPDCLSIVWNVGKMASLSIDTHTVKLRKNCVLFLTEYHNIEAFEFEHIRVIQFNRALFCLEQDDSDVGCRGVLFFGASTIPKVIIPAREKKPFELVWEVILMEMRNQDALKQEMLQILLKRFLVLCVRLYAEGKHDLPHHNVNVGIIREFHYLVERNFRTYTTVSDYAKMLHRSPKTLANIFGKYIDISPLQVIQQRRLLEAKRKLKNTELDVQEIAEGLGFTDLQTFSHFFRRLEGIPPHKLPRTNATGRVVARRYLQSLHFLHWVSWGIILCSGDEGLRSLACALGRNLCSSLPFGGKY